MILMPEVIMSYLHSNPTRSSEPKPYEVHNNIHKASEEGYDFSSSHSDSHEEDSMHQIQAVARKRTTFRNKIHVRALHYLKKLQECLILLQTEDQEMYLEDEELLHMFNEYMKFKNKRSFHSTSSSESWQHAKSQSQHFLSHGFISSKAEHRNHHSDMTEREKRSVDDSKSNRGDNYRSKPISFDHSQNSSLRFDSSHPSSHERKTVKFSRLDLRSLKPKLCFENEDVNDSAYRDPHQMNNTSNVSSTGSSVSVQYAKGPREGKPSQGDNTATGLNISKQSPKVFLSPSNIQVCINKSYSESPGRASNRVTVQCHPFDNDLTKISDSSGISSRSLYREASNNDVDEVERSVDFGATPQHSPLLQKQVNEGRKSSNRMIMERTVEAAGERHLSGRGPTTNLSPSYIPHSYSNGEEPIDINVDTYAYNTHNNDSQSSSKVSHHPSCSDGDIFPEAASYVLTPQPADVTVMDLAHKHTSKLKREKGNLHFDSSSIARRVASIEEVLYGRSLGGGDEESDLDDNYDDVYIPMPVGPCRRYKKAGPLFIKGPSTERQSDPLALDFEDYIKRSHATDSVRSHHCPTVCANIIDPHDAMKATVLIASCRPAADSDYKLSSAINTSRSTGHNTSSTAPIPTPHLTPIKRVEDDDEQSRTSIGIFKTAFSILGSRPQIPDPIYKKSEGLSYLTDGTRDLKRSNNIVDEIKERAEVYARSSAHPSIPSSNTVFPESFEKPADMMFLSIGITLSNRRELFGLPGVHVKHVKEHSPCYKLGLRPGDIILEWNPIPNYVLTNDGSSSEGKSASSSEVHSKNQSSVLYGSLRIRQVHRLKDIATLVATQPSGGQLQIVFVSSKVLSTQMHDDTSNQIRSIRYSVQIPAIDFDLQQSQQQHDGPSIKPTRSILSNEECYTDRVALSVSQSVSRSTSMGLSTRPTWGYYNDNNSSIMSSYSIMNHSESLPRVSTTSSVGSSSVAEVKFSDLPAKVYKARVGTVIFDGNASLFPCPRNRHSIPYQLFGRVCAG